MIWIIMIGFMIVGGIVNSRLKSKFKKKFQTSNNKILIDGDCHNIHVLFFTKI